MITVFSTYNNHLIRRVLFPKLLLRQSFHIRKACRNMRRGLLQSLALSSRSCRLSCLLASSHDLHRVCIAACVECVAVYFAAGVAYQCVAYNALHPWASLASLASLSRRLRRCLNHLRRFSRLHRLLRYQLRRLRSSRRLRRLQSFRRRGARIPLPFISITHTNTQTHTHTHTHTHTPPRSRTPQLDAQLL
jgi:hypothetical protein